MKLLVAVPAVTVLLSTFAFAADMSEKAPPHAPAPGYSWTAFYVGGNAGYGWGDPRTEIAGAGTSITDPFGCPQCFTNPPATFADSQTRRRDGFIGGGQIGYNYQVGPNWLLGIEADIQNSAQRGSNTIVDPLSGTFCIGLGVGSCVINGPLTGTATTSYEAKIEWFGTVRGRIGVMINDGLLLYGTGGLAYGRVGISGNVGVNAAAAGSFGPTTSAFAQSKTNAGFAAGVGLEGRFPAWLSQNYTWKLEYLYIDLGSLDTSTSFIAASSVPAIASNLTGTMTTHTHFVDNGVRVGLNYQFH